MKKAILLILCCVSQVGFAAHGKMKLVKKPTAYDNVLSSALFSSPPAQISEEKIITNYRNSWVYTWQSADEHWQNVFSGLRWQSAMMG